MLLEDKSLLREEKLQNEKAFKQIFKINLPGRNVIAKKYRYLLRKGYIPLQILYKQVKSAILLNVHKNVCFLLQRLQLL